MKKYTIVAALAAAGAGCGGEADPVCGNGEVERGEQCDDGNDVDDDFCTNRCVQHLPATLNVTVQWAFNKQAADGFETDSCLDLGVARVEVELVGPQTLTQDEACGFRQVVFLDLEPGTYTARVRPLDGDGALLTTAPVEKTFEVGTASVTEEVVVPYEAWANNYRGTFFFRLAWGAADCADAVPPVTHHRLRLEQDGVAMSGFVTDEGDTVDGTGPPRPCRSNQMSIEQFPQSVVDLPWGPAKFTVQGFDGEGEKRFEETFDTFIGAGKSNPELLFDVDSLAPDAGVPDAGAPDAP